MKTEAAPWTFAGQRMLVIGGGGGIGQSVCAGLLAGGAEVWCLDHPAVSVPAGTHPLPCDLADPAAIHAALVTLAASTAHLDGLIHAAGITRDGVLWKLTPDDWSSVMRVNLDSAYHALHTALPLLRLSPQGRVVLITSINGERGKRGQSNYAASKAGLIGLARSLAREVGPLGIRVNCVAPGFINTPLTASLPEAVRDAAIAETALGRLGEPADVAHAVLFLLSAYSRHITGQVLRVDGGQLMA